MHVEVSLSHAEVVEAVRDWCEKQGITVPPEMLGTKITWLPRTTARPPVVTDPTISVLFRPTVPVPPETA